MNTLNKLLIEANKVTMKDLKIDKKLFNKPKLSTKPIKSKKSTTSKKSKKKTSKKSKTKTSKKSKKKHLRNLRHIKKTNTITKSKKLN